MTNWGHLVQGPNETNKTIELSLDDVIINTCGTERTVNITVTAAATSSTPAQNTANPTTSATPTAVLAKTGSTDTGTLGAIAAALVAAGVSLLVAVRRLRTTS